MGKKALLFVNLIFVLLAAICVCMGLFLLWKDDGEESKWAESTSEQIEIIATENETIETEEEMESTTEETENKITFLNLGKIYYLPLDTTSFKNQVAAFIENNHLLVTTVIALDKVEDNKEETDGIANFYLQLDDATGTILLAAYDKKAETFTLSLSEAIFNAEDYGGMTLTESDDVSLEDEPEYHKEGTEIINLGDAKITDVDQTLSNIADMDELQHNLGIFLNENEEERRNLFVSSLEKTETGYKTVLEFETARIDRKKIEVVYEDGKYHFSLID